MTKDISISRRELLKTTAAGALYLTVGLPILAKADFPKRVHAPRQFIGASSALLGINGKDLNPTIAPDDYSMADEYYTLLQAGCSTGVQAMMDEYATYQGRLPPQVVGNRFLRAHPDRPEGGIRDDQVGTAARLNLQLWLFGIWYGAHEIGMNVPSKRVLAPSYRHDFVISSRAYKQGWVWRLAQSHPMGFSQLPFGQWAMDPPPLQDYIPHTKLD